ncbi:unnamed protein product [Linum trigynum]|uniref:Uncharacterized protein n=1 Tax=Linum trigynum TaxID=586398 RepID=A0AAV2C9S4_9ROSI
MAEQDEKQRDWRTHLPGELLDTIMRRLTKLLPNYGTSSASKPWRLAVLDQEQNPPKFLQSLPWQMYFPTEAGNSCPGGADDCHRFIDVAENDKCHLHINLAPDTFSHGSAYGWLILQQEQYEHWLPRAAGTLSCSLLVEPFDGEKDPSRE